jgi:nucleotide-binding universal stress UspA family protein
MFKKILVPTTFQDASKKALGYAVELSQKFNSEIHVLHIIEDNQIGLVESMLYKPSSAEVMTSQIPAEVNRKSTEKIFEPDAIRKRFADDADKSMKVFISEFEKKTKINTNITIGNVYQEIIKKVKEEKIDLILMGRSKKVLKEIFLGSIADKVARTAPCPVWLV